MSRGFQTWTWDMERTIATQEKSLPRALPITAVSQLSVRPTIRATAVLEVRVAGAVAEDWSPTKPQALILVGKTERKKMKADAWNWAAMCGIRTPVRTF